MFIGKSKGYDDYDPHVVHYADELRRFASFAGLARLMRHPAKVQISNVWWLKLNLADPVGTLFVRTLTEKNEQVLARLSLSWPAEARRRFDAARTALD